MKKANLFLLFLLTFSFAHSQGLVIPMTFKVNSPAPIAGEFNYGKALFGPTIIPTVTGDLEWAYSAPGDSLCCTAISTNLVGKVALIRRGACSFVTKIYNAQNAGAIGCIILNNTGTNDYIDLGDDASGNGALITIPSIMLSVNDGLLITAQMSPTNAVNVTFDPGTLNNGYLTRSYGRPLDQIPPIATMQVEVYNSNASSILTDVTLDITDPLGSTTNFFEQIPIAGGTIQTISFSSSYVPSMLGTYTGVFKSSLDVNDSLVINFIITANTFQLDNGNLSAAFPIGPSDALFASGGYRHDRGAFYEVGINGFSGDSIQSSFAMSNANVYFGETFTFRLYEVPNTGLTGIDYSALTLVGEKDHIITASDTLVQHSLITETLNIPGMNAPLESLTQLKEHLLVIYHQGNGLILQPPLYSHTHQMAIGGNNAVFLDQLYAGGWVGGYQPILRMQLFECEIAYGTDTQSACDSYTWIDGNTYFSSNNTATYTILDGAANACDSIVTLNLTITNTAYGTDTQTTCGPYTWIDGNTYSTSTSSPQHIIVGGASSGCDSIVTLNLTINSAVNYIDVQSSCLPFTWIDGNTYSSSNSTASFTYPNGASNGCDSVLHLNFTLVTAGTVMNVSATNIDASSALITWDALPIPPANFTIQYQIAGSGTWISSGNATATSTSYYLAPLSPGTTYMVRVSGNCASTINGTFSTPYFFSTTSLNCNSPMTLSGSGNTGNSITLSWPSIPVAGWYEFRYKESSSSTWLFGGTTGGSATIKLFGSLNPSTSYDFQGRTYCPNGVVSIWSNVYTETTGVLAGCSLFPAVSASSISGNSVVISWPAVPSTSWFEFRYKPSSSSTWISGGTAAGTATSKPYTGLTTSTSYDFEARSFCSNGIFSAWGGTVFTTTALSGCELPPAFDFPLFSSTNSSVQVKWTTNPSAAWYSLQYKESTSSIWVNGGTASGAATAKTYSGLNSSTSYDFQIRSHCSSGVASYWGATSSYSTSGLPSITTNTNDAKPNDDLADKALEQIEQQIKVYPNPASNELFIELISEKSDGPLNISILDMSGRLVQNITIKSNENIISLDISELTSGLYTLFIVQNGTLQQTSKVRKL